MRTPCNSHSLWPGLAPQCASHAGLLHRPADKEQSVSHAVCNSTVAIVSWVSHWMAAHCTFPALICCNRHNPVTSEEDFERIKRCPWWALNGEDGIPHLVSPDMDSHSLFTGLDSDGKKLPDRVFPSSPFL